MEGAKAGALEKEAKLLLGLGTFRLDFSVVTLNDGDVAAGEEDPLEELLDRLDLRILPVDGERPGDRAEALSYNALVQSWPEIMRLAREGGHPRPAGL